MDNQWLPRPYGVGTIIRKGERFYQAVSEVDLLRYRLKEVTKAYAEFGISVGLPTVIVRV